MTFNPDHTLFSLLYAFENNLKLYSLQEKDTVMLGEISPYHEDNSTSVESSETPPSYSQLNYRENIERFVKFPIPHLSTPITVDVNVTVILFVKKNKILPKSSKDNSLSRVRRENGNGPIQY